MIEKTHKYIYYYTHRYRKTNNSGEGTYKETGGNTVRGKRGTKEIQREVEKETAIKRQRSIEHQLRHTE